MEADLITRNVAREARGVLVLFALVGCFGEPPSPSGSSSDPSASGTGAEGSTSEAPTSEETATSEGEHCGCAPVGIEACDFYIAEFCPCIEEHAPESTRQEQLEAFQETCETWSDAAQGSDAEALAQGCAAAVEAVAATAAGWGCQFDPVAGSCLGYCNTDAKIPDGSETCHCDAECGTRKDCCSDFSDVCGEKAIEPFDASVVEISGRESDSTGDEVAMKLAFPSIQTYPERAPSLLSALAAEREPVAVLAGLRDSFAAARWRSLDEWDRFGAIDVGVGFVSLRRGVRRRHDASLGCLGGFVEGVRLLQVPELSLTTVLEPTFCGALGKACDPDLDTGVLALANIQARHLKTWELTIASPPDAAAVEALFTASEVPYLVSASHVSRRDGIRRFHHMLIVIADEDSAANGPIVFDVTGLRGMSLRRVSWPRLQRYFGGALADSSRFAYEAASVQVAVLHP